MEQNAGEKALSPSALTARRFFRNRLAVIGLAVLGFMFLFSFLGGALTPYGQDQVFYRSELQSKEYAAITENTDFRFTAAPGQTIDPVLQAQLTLAVGKKDSFSYGGQVYTLRQEGQDFYSVWTDTLVGIAHKDFVTPETDFDTVYAGLKAYTNGQHADVSISRFVISSRTAGEVSQAFRMAAEQAVKENAAEFSVDGRHFSVAYDAANRLWSIREDTATRVWDAYAAPSKSHLLGTDKNGMDMLTRLMYGGRVSLVIGFIVVLISALLGVLFGGIAGYFGGWTDEAIMRLVDVFYCIPTTPLLIILGAAMDGMRVDPQVRMLFLMLILGFLGWPSIARLVRGQILSLREQEFMTAAEAAGLSVGRRIFRHLIPNVIPQLIVVCTMSLGSTILTEATLSFLGLGVKFPFASWGNIMNDVSNPHVLTSYWFVWIPAGVCLVLSVLGFNFVGDGLRDAFDPKMKR